MLRSNVSDHGMRKYCLGIYKHMPGGLEAHSSYFFVRPVTKLRKTIERAQQEQKQDEDTGEAETGVVLAKEGLGSTQNAQLVGTALDV